MKRMLGRKQSSNNGDWLYAMEHIEELVTRDEVDLYTAKAVGDIKRAVKGKRAAFAWSGGKDSLVIADLCRQAGVADSVFVHTELEYPAFLDWCMKHKPDGCEVINVGMGLDWLAKNPQMLFPANSTLNYKWFTSVQQTGIREYFLAHKLDFMIVGHRKADGNYVGRDNISTNKKGVVRYSAIADWPHEMILAYVHYNRLPMPPIYDWKDGYRCGTHSWAARSGMRDVREGWAQVYEIDPSIVIGASAKIESAREFLASLKEGADR